MGAPLRLVLASNNAKKLAELRALLAGWPLAIVAQGELGIAEAEEPHHTFVENALAKARHAARASGGAAIADDSGLCVGALGGAPGVISAHYGGEVALIDGEDREARRRRQDAVNNAALLAALAALGPQADRRGHFISTLVAVRHADDPEPLVAVGRWPGQVLTAARGSQGFGYDPLMYIPALDATVAELSAEVKNTHSHRARSAAALRAMLAEAWHLSADPVAGQGAT
ncbi:MAG: non-canonical purine NTP pyrophosphatase [Burkholderiales bacterium PBB5]|nr:MAG: non-canonical purine NTP pyrophosphatase [Burkholderiales bacterium PBB5]